MEVPSAKCKRLMGQTGNRRTTSDCRRTSTPPSFANTSRFLRLLCRRIESSSEAYPRFSSWVLACTRSSSHLRNCVLSTICSASSGLTPKRFSNMAGCGGYEHANFLLPEERGAPRTWKRPCRSDSSSSLNRPKFWTSNSRMDSFNWKRES